MEELIDVLDENGIKTGEVLTRSEVHKKGLWHGGAVVACIDKSGKVLMQQRSQDVESYKGYWDISAAGHISAGQDSLMAGMRELGEEVGIKAEKEKMKLLTRYKRSYISSKEYIDNLFVDCYVVQLDSIDINNIKKQESEVAQIRLCSIDEIMKLIDENRVLPRESFYDELLDYLRNMNKDNDEFDM